MKMLCLTVAVLMLLLNSVHAQIGLPFPGPGAANAGGGGSGYIGPGNAVSVSAKTFWSCARGYNAASVGAKACNICNVSDVACVDVLVGSNGFVTIPTIGGSDCTSVTCTIKTFYDQSGANACGGSACDATATVISARANLTVSALGGKACGSGFTTSIAYLVANTASFVGLSQPFTASAVFKNADSSPGGILGDAGAIGFFDSGTNWGFFASTNFTDGASDTTTYHSFQMTATSLPRIVIDSSTTTGGTNAAGTAAFGSTLKFATDAYHRYEGIICELGLWSGFNTSDDSAMTSNQHGSANGYNF